MSADPADKVLELEHFLPYRLSVLSNRISQALSRLYSDRFGLTILEWRVLAILGRYPGLAANAVARRGAMDKVQVSRAVHRLLANGRLERRLDPDDRRRSSLRLSPEGKRIYRQIIPAAQAFEQGLLAPLTAGEQSSLDDLLTRLTGHTDDVNH